MGKLKNLFEVLIFHEKCKKSMTFSHELATGRGRFLDELAICSSALHPNSIIAALQQLLGVSVPRIPVGEVVLGFLVHWFIVELCRSGARCEPLSTAALLSFRLHIQ